MMNGLQLTAKTLESTNLKLFWFLDLDLAVNAVNILFLSSTLKILFKHCLLPCWLLS